MVTAAHNQVASHRYIIHYPAHEPRWRDPWYADFRAYKKRRKTEGTYVCDFAMEHRAGDMSECDTGHPLECHHRHIEFATMNSVDIKLLDPKYPGVSKIGVGAWVESAENLMLLCQFHHRSHAGVHVASASDYEATFFIRGLIS